MTAPERITLYLTEQGQLQAQPWGGAQPVEYVRADLIPAALAVQALVEAVERERNVQPYDIAAQGVWPDFIAPPKHDNPDPRWQDPSLPDFRLIWKVARECGYSVGLHGSMKRDCDMIAAPWTDDAVIAFELIDRLCSALNARIVGPVAGKPHGRLGWNLQVDGYVKVIDISVMPRSQDVSAPALAVPEVALPDNFDRLVADGISEAMKAMRRFPQPNYVISKIAEEAGEVVKAAIHAAEGRETAENLRGEMKQLIAMLYRLWIEGDQVHGLGSVSAALRGDTVTDADLRRDAEHVNGTAETEHDAGNVLAIAALRGEGGNG